MVPPLSKRAKEGSNIKGYVWCRISDIIEDLQHHDRKEVIMACLDALEEFTEKK